jgi:hypothetical protein
LGAAFFLAAGTAALALGASAAFDVGTWFDAAMVALCLSSGVGMLGVGIRGLRGEPIAVTRGWPGVLLVALVGTVLTVGLAYRLGWEPGPLIDGLSTVRAMVVYGVFLAGAAVYRTAVRLRRRRFR